MYLGPLTGLLPLLMTMLMMQQLLEVQVRLYTQDSSALAEKGEPTPAPTIATVPLAKLLGSLSKIVSSRYIATRQGKQITSQKG
jgi:hypothetical protein